MSSLAPHNPSRIQLEAPLFPHRASAPGPCRCQSTSPPSCCCSSSPSDLFFGHEEELNDGSLGPSVVPHIGSLLSPTAAQDPPYSGRRNYPAALQLQEPLDCHRTHVNQCGSTRRHPKSICDCCGQATDQPRWRSRGICHVQPLATTTPRPAYTNADTRSQAGSQSDAAAYGSIERR